MKRSRIAIGIILVAVLLAGTGCSKAAKEKAALQGEISSLHDKIKLLEAKEKEQQAQQEKAAIKANEEKLRQEEFVRALQVRLTHQPLDQFKIEPYAGQENGWLIIDGLRTYTLFGHAGATKVQFYLQDVGTASSKPQLLGEDTAGKDGWSWQGTLPFGIMKAFWAEVQYPGGVTVTSAVLPIRNGGK